MGALFDLSFSKFVSPTIAKIVYIIGMVVIALTYLAFLVSSFDASAALGLFVLLIGGPLVALFYLCLLRVALESLLAMIYTAQNTSELVRMGGGAAPASPSFGPGGPSGPPPGSYPPPGNYPPPSGQAPPSGPPFTPPPGAPPAP